MKTMIILFCLSAVVVGCNRNRVGDERGYIEPEAERSTIKTGTSELDAQTAGPGSATGPAEETSGGTYGTGSFTPEPAGGQAPAQQPTNSNQPPAQGQQAPQGRR